MLIVPELYRALKMIGEIGVSGAENLMQLKHNAVYMQEPWKSILSNLDMNWDNIRRQIEEWVYADNAGIVSAAFDMVGFAVTFVSELLIGFIFAIYILAKKEELKTQTLRLTKAWFPERTAEKIIHALSVCGKTFHLFVGGQAIESVFLGILCMIGMFVLRIPYAPMIGILIGVTALIPVVGSFVGTVVGTIMILTVSPLKAFLFLAFLLILQHAEGDE